MDNNEMSEKILNKKFKKSIFSGYDTADVDKYFDLVIEYLKNNDKMVKTYADDIANLKKLVQKLQIEKENLMKENKKLALEVEEYKAEGYGNVSLKRKK